MDKLGAPASAMHHPGELLELDLRLRDPRI
jgi:hypothetical protein